VITAGPDAVGIVLAVNNATVDPWGAITAAGTITPVLLDDMEMLMLPAALDNMITQTVPVPPTSAAGEHDIEKRVGVDHSVRLAVVEEPPRLAVSVAVVSAVIVPAVAISVPVALPAATETVPGTVASVEDELIVTLVFDATAPLKVTVHMVAPPLIRPVRLQVRDFNAGARLSVMLADCEVPL